MSDLESKQLVQMHRFEVEIGESIARISEISGIEVSVEIHEYREGDMKENYVRKIPGLKRYGNITFKGGVVNNKDDFLKWVLEDPPEQKDDLTIKAKKRSEDDDDSEEVTWKAEKVLPVKYVGPEFSGTKSEIAFESLEVAIENLKREE